MGLFNPILEEKILNYIEFLQKESPESSIRNYILNLIEEKNHLFPAFINTFTGAILLLILQNL